MAPHEALPSKKHLPFGGARAIRNPVLIEFLRYCSGEPLIEMLESPYLISQYLNRYKSWLASSHINDLSGFEKFPNACYSNGTTEIFDKWYVRNHGKRLRMFRGEYMYHLAVHRNLNISYKWLEDGPLEIGDHVVMSMPFADTGCLHPQAQSILDTAALLDVPVLIDAAFLGLTKGITFDFSHPAIDTIAVSLSKAFPLAYARVGMRLTKKDLDDGLDIYHKTSYENRLGAALGLMFMSNYGIDYNQKCYGHWQKYKCDEMGLIPSNTVIFGLGGDEWHEYNRGGLANRLFLGDFFESQF